MTKEEWNRFLLVAVIVILVGLLGLILLIRLVISLSRRPTEKAEEPPVPAARVVRDRDKP
ncbi:MAG TPA: hypothetical protein VFK02_36785 [Kofleriaceae bacterium]|nr:hypothetical protein [Kofleriaceae bacterium]